MKQMDENKKYRVYGAIGMVALFLLGCTVGFILNGSDRVNHSIMTKSQCEYLSVKMQYAVESNDYGAIGQLNKIYSENCLDRNFDAPKPQQKTEENKMPESTCGKIEQLLLDRLYSVNAQNSEAHIENAKIYANLSERGCAENSEKYKELAKQELEIARALNDDNIQRDPEESVEIVETYKRLKMQQEAEKMIEKAKKLTNPAIDFIIQLEKVLNEE